MLATLITTHFDTSLRAASATIPASFNVAKYTRQSGEKIPFPKDNRGSIAIYPHHAKVLRENSDDFRDWDIVNKVDVYSYISEADLEDIIKAIKEVLDNHQVTGYLKHWWDDEVNQSGYGWKAKGNIYSILGESY